MRSTVWRLLTSHPEVVSSFLAAWDAWLKTCDVPNYISQPFRAQTWAPVGPLGVRLGAAACRIPVPAGSPSPAFSVEPGVRETGGAGQCPGGRAGCGGPRPLRVGRASSRHRPPRAANRCGGTAPGLEPERDWPARGPGRGAGEASAVSAVIREGKVPCAESRAGARSYGGRSGRAGPAGRAEEEDPRLRPRLPRCLSDLGHVPGFGGRVHSGHGRRRGARRGTRVAGGARTAGGAPAHLPLGADPPA